MSQRKPRAVHFIEKAAEAIRQEDPERFKRVRKTRLQEVETCLSDASRHLGEDIYGFPKEAIQTGLLKAIREVLPEIDGFTEVNPLVMQLGNRELTLSGSAYVSINNGNATAASRTTVEWAFGGPRIKGTHTPLRAAQASVSEGERIQVSFPPVDTRRATRCTVVVGFTPESHEPKAFYIEHNNHR